MHCSKRRNDTMNKKKYHWGGVLWKYAHKGEKKENTPLQSTKTIHISLKNVIEIVFFFFKKFYFGEEM
jgi:hypothetical protein